MSHRSREHDAMCGVCPLDRYRRGDASALRELMRAHGAAMRAAAHRYVRTDTDIDDATQEAWLAFARSSRTITKPDRVGSWLCTTTARAALSIARRNARDEQAAEIADLWSPAGGSNDELADNDTVRALRNAISRLGRKDQQLAALLLESDELSYAALSARIGRPVGSIGPTRQRLIEKLRRDPELRRLVVIAHC